MSHKLTAVQQQDMGTAPKRRRPRFASSPTNRWHSRRRIGAALMALLFIVSTLASTLVSTGVFADPQKVAMDASQSLYASMSPSDQAKTWLYYNAMSACVSKSGVAGSTFTGNSSEDGIKQGKWFASGGPVPSIGYVIGALGLSLNGWPLDKLKCDGDGAPWINDAIKTFGYSDNLSAWCDMTNNLNTSDGNLCSGASSKGWSTTDADEALQANFQTVVKRKVFAGQEPSLTDAARYVIAKSAFFGGCLGTASPSPYTGSEGGDFVYKDVPVVDSTGKLTTTTYNGVKKSGDSIKYSFSPSGDDVSDTCGNLVKQMQQYNVAYTTAAVAIVTGGNSGGDKTTTGGSTNGADNSTTSCAIEGVGWIVCPVVNFLAGIADGAYSFLADNFLSTPTALLAMDSSNVTYTAWQKFVGIANILFVIGFMVIIFSQLTGLGVSNYGVKKLLPRLIVGAILINISFIICAIAVDLSNILGYGLKTFLAGIAGTSTDLTVAGTSTLSSGTTGSGWVGIAGTVLAGGAAAATGVAAAGGITLALIALLGILVSALIALIMIFFVLQIRQVLIVLLIVLSPLAFVAYLLPNTSQWFTKWRKTFTAMLMLFPIIGLVYGASSLASKIISGLYAGKDSMLGQIVGAGVMILPLFVVPMLLKKSLDSVGALGGKLSAIGGKLQGRAKSQSTKALENSRMGQYGKYRQGETAKRRALMQSGAYSGKGGNWNPRNWRSAVNRRFNESGASGRFGDRSLATGTALAEKEDAELVANAGTRLDSMSFKNATGQAVPLTQAQMMQIATGKDVTHDGTKNGKVVMAKGSFDENTRRAAIQRAAKIATVKDAEALVDSSTTMEKAERKTLSSSLAGSSVISKAPYLGGKTLGDIEQGTADTKTAALAAIKAGKITSESLASTDKDSAATLLSAAQSTAFGSDERRILKEAYEGINKPGSRLHEKIAANTEHERTLQGMRSL